MASEPKECSRSVLSCERCRRRKIKCDRSLPSCSQCESARTPCKGFSSQFNATDIPRSIVQHLESEIARLETELAQTGHLDALNASDILINMPAGGLVPAGSEIAQPDFNMSSTDGGGGKVRLAGGDGMRDSIMASGEVQAMVSATIPSGPGLTDLVSRIRMGLTPSSALATTTGHEHRRSSVTLKSIRAEIATPVLRGLPTHIVQSLVKKYCMKILPLFPFMFEPTILNQLEVVLSATKNATSAGPSSMTVAPSYDFLFIYLILAVSVTLGSAKSGHESRCMALSVSIFEEGIQHLTARTPVISDLAGLQATLLILQYATINPRSANVWILSGAAMRSCLELGLHRDSSEAMQLDPLTADLRRRIFWSAYCMDRAICSAVQRPLSIPDPAISTEFPSLIEDEHITKAGTEERATSAAKGSALRWIAYAQLQSSILEVHFQGKELPPDSSWEDWLATTEAKLRSWYADCGAAVPRSEFALAYGLTILHRPSPRVPMPSPHSLLTAFEAASHSARCTRDHISHGFFRRPWLSAHYTLETAMIVLFCLRHGSAPISTKFDPSTVFEMTKLFTANFLSIAAQGWTEVSNYAGIYERLLGPLLERLFGDNKKSPEVFFGPAQDAELMRLLYPGPAHLEKLRFGSSFARKDWETFDPNLFNWEEDLGSLAGSMPGGGGMPGSAGLKGSNAGMVPTANMGHGQVVSERGQDGRMSSGVSEFPGSVGRPPEGPVWELLENAMGGHEEFGLVF